MSAPQGQARAYLYALFGRRREEAAVRAAVDALVAELDAAGPAPDDDAIMHVRDVLAEHAETVMHRRMVGSKRGAHAYVQPSADLDAAVLALMLRHRDDTVGTSPKRPTTAVSYTHLTLPTICSV